MNPTFNPLQMMQNLAQSPVGQALQTGFNTLSQAASHTQQAIERSPLSEVKDNAQIVLNHTWRQLDLVTRQDWEIQEKMLLRLAQRVHDLEARLAELENTAPR